jgi:hypothetical protein
MVVAAIALVCAAASVSPAARPIRGLSLDILTALRWEIFGHRHDPAASPAVVVAIDEEIEHDHLAKPVVVPFEIDKLLQRKSGEESGETVIEGFELDGGSAGGGVLESACLTAGGSGRGQDASILAVPLDGAKGSPGIFFNGGK